MLEKKRVYAIIFTIYAFDNMFSFKSKHALPLKLFVRDLKWKQYLKKKKGKNLRKK